MRVPDYSAYYSMGIHRTGDTFLERTFTVTADHGDLTKVVITSYDEVFLSSDNTGEIVITDAANGVWKILEQEITLIPRSYEFLVTFTFTDGVERAYIYGTWTITK